MDQRSSWESLPVGSPYLLGVSTCWESLPVGFHVKSLLTLRDQFLEDGVTWNKPDQSLEPLCAQSSVLCNGKLSWISRFCGYSLKSSLQIWECGMLWHGKSEQSAKIFSNLWKFSPLKFPTMRYMYVWSYIYPLLQSGNWSLYSTGNKCWSFCTDLFSMKAISEEME